MSKLEKKIFISGTITAKTGLSIGGGSVGLEIGGADKVVVRNTLNNQPYIPGSSLKGKMRSLLEQLKGKFSKKDDKFLACQCGTCEICLLFGSLPTKNEKKEEKGGTARLIVRDSPLTPESARLLGASRETDMPMTEVKTEVFIDRITSQATPRQFERVPAGAEFTLSIICNVFESDDEREMLDTLFTGMRLLQDDFLGGSGTRGYGRIKFKLKETMLVRDRQAYLQGVDARPYDESPVSVPPELQ
ncbi:MAG: type III-A CRISPR-associated RAMP protein Csm3 [Deltaproteobacteria bacterium]|nr:type III-A CRISPR-associated RAMP protein Csm3 [Deltaproteobacteria bacterium]MBW2306911.1 type III-A CRISPR-associated RAMP protein Csm3 [Deltaproteobacteria bacterium]